MSEPQDQPKIDDLKRLLRRLEQVSPEKTAAKSAPPVPPPLPEAARARSNANALSVAPDKNGAGGSTGGSAMLPLADFSGPPAGTKRPAAVWVSLGVAAGLAAGAGLVVRASDPGTQIAAIQARPVEVMDLRAAVRSRAEESRIPLKTPIDAAGTGAQARPVAAEPAASPTPRSEPSERLVLPTASPSDRVLGGPAAEAPQMPAGGLEGAAVMRAQPPAGRDKYEAEARLDAYLERGQRLIDAGDLTGARAFFRRVAESGDPRGALAMGATYDASYFAELGIRGGAGDAEAAGEWYRRAMDLGSKDALDRLERLGVQ